MQVKDKEKETKFFRTFSWMLSADQKKTVDSIVKNAVLSARGRCLAQLQIQDQGTEEQAEGGGQPASSSGQQGNVEQASAVNAEESKLVRMVGVAEKRPRAAGKKNAHGDKDLQKDALLGLLKRAKTAAA